MRVLLDEKPYGYYLNFPFEFHLLRILINYEIYYLLIIIKL